jgi:hypothetical protein
MGIIFIEKGITMHYIYINAEMAQAKQGCGSIAQNLAAGIRKPR